MIPAKKYNVKNWKKTFASHVTDNRLVFTMYEEFLQLTKKDNPSGKWTKDLNTDYPKNNTQAANEDMTRCQTSLIVRET